jgi:hypothetical protein
MPARSDPDLHLIVDGAVISPIEVSKPFYAFEIPRWRPLSPSILR